MRALGMQDTKGFGIKSQQDVQQAAAWDILVLKGNAFPGNQGDFASFLPSASLCYHLSGKSCNTDINSSLITQSRSQAKVVYTAE